MKEPRRHESTDRNRRKALRQVNRVLDELHYLHRLAMKSLGHFEYAIKKTDKLRNRLKAENDSSDSGNDNSRGEKPK
jgi:hypothetical protein